MESNKLFFFVVQLDLASPFHPSQRTDGPRFSASPGDVQVSITTANQRRLRHGEVGRWSGDGVVGLQRGVRCKGSDITHINGRN